MNMTTTRRSRLALFLCVSLAVASAAVDAQQTASPHANAPRADVPVLDLYNGAIPNSLSVPDQEHWLETDGVEKVSHPTIALFLPPVTRASHSAVIIFPGGSYVMEVYEREGTRIAQEFQDRGIAAFVVKYRLPSDATMPDKTIGPLQDAQQAIRVVRQNAAKWNIDADKIGVMGFSAGGHLASTAGTHFDKPYSPNPDSINVRPDFMILVYPVISMTTELAHPKSRKALLGADPTPQQIQLFSNDEQVTDKTPPTLLLHAGDDTVVDVDNSVRFYEALRHHHVPAEMILFPAGEHGFPRLDFDSWFNPILNWMTKSGWQKP
jgi:acetyl esterase/lipase